MSSLCAITCLFNPSGYQTKTPNYARFRAGLEAAGVPCIVVECAFGQAPFALPPAPDVVQVRANSVLWQKERLLNIALAHLPPACTKVLWLDADLLFAEPQWAAQTEDLLDTYAVVQPFSRVVRLPRGALTDDGTGESWSSFAAVLQSQPDLLLCGDFERHGHTGFAWAARRDFLDAVGLFDACVAGSGDHMMAHAFAGDWHSPCISRILGPDSPQYPNGHRASFVAWCQRAYPLIRARIGSVPGTLLHLWHGETANRRYAVRNRELAAFGFDPTNDLRIGPSGCYEWASPKPEMHQWAIDYFASRREDGDDPPPSPTNVTDTALANPASDASIPSIPR